MALFSKFQTIDTTCKDYVHPWSDSCVQASFSLVKPCVKESLRIYVTAYMFSLLLRGKTPSKNDLYRTLFGIIQSCIFLTSHGVGFPAAVCIVRRFTGKFYFLTLSFIPSFLSSLCSILIERPSRRSLLSLYVTNVASETVFRMLVHRKLVKPIPYGEIFIFCSSVASLLYFNKSSELPKDPMYSMLKFLVGSSEGYKYIKTEEEVPASKLKSENQKNILLKFQAKVINAWKRFIFDLKSLSSHPSCPHQFSCAHYVLQAGSQKFMYGYIIQILLRCLLNINKIKKNPKLLLEIPFKYDNMTLGLFLSGFSSVFKIISCFLRRTNGEDNPLHAFPAGFLAGLFFYFYRDRTIALYFMWKTFQICYNKAAEKGHVPILPWAPVFFHAFSTAILFHTALIEPNNLRPSYWNFLHAMSGERVAHMDRVCLDKFGLESSKHLEIVLSRKRTKN